MWSPLSPSAHMVTLFLVFQVPTAKGFVRAVCGHNSTIHNFDALPALFGPPIPKEGLAGLLVEAKPADACQPIEGPPNTTSTFIVLIRRYDCSFGTKVLHAQQAGFQAAIVHNVHSPNLVQMVSELDAKDHIHIPAMFIADVASRALKRLHRARKLTSLILVPEYFHFIWKGSSGITRISSSYRCQCQLQLPGPCLHMVSLYTCWIICISVSALIVSLLIEKYVFGRQAWKQRKNQILQENDWTDVSFTSSRYQECAICLEKYTEHDSLKVLSCSHAFHSKCIDLWHVTQTRSKTCPLCMQKVLVVTRLQAVKLWKDGTGENKWTLSLGKGKTIPNGQRSFLLLSQWFPSHF
ncbi:E3 ubiquitin-protein ligase RNF13-like [Sceloporus undulatus]|uniref:E3 ubiquitin-protein ligase RNF13-like n=1 Tax=Sceloporus undulatus TaxID=8520 RepID=UPI001C4B415F|nr:E3 ubiquitin-protein ligase RNF13-like [Sceloporus undulatus]